MDRRLRALSAALWVFALICTLSCDRSEGGGKGKPAADGKAPKPQAAAEGVPVAAAAKDKAADKSEAVISKTDGTLLYKLSCKGEKCKLYDKDNAHVATVKDKGEKKKVYDPQEKELLSCKQKEYGYSVKDAADNDLYKLKLEEGNYKLKDKDGKTLFKIKLKGNLYVITDEKTDLAKVKEKDGKVVVEDKDGKEILTMSGIPLLPAAFMALETLDITVRLGLQCAVRDMGHVQQ